MIERLIKNGKTGKSDGDSIQLSLLRRCFG
jgi:hypothetical protein